MKPISADNLFTPFHATGKQATKLFGPARPHLSARRRGGWFYWSTYTTSVGPFKTEKDAERDAISYALYKARRWGERP